MSWIYTMVAAHTLAMGVLAILLVPVVRKAKRNRADFAFLGMLLSLMIWIACNGTSKYLIFFYHLELGFIPAIGGVASLCLGLNFYLVCEFLHQPRIPRHQKKRIVGATIPSLIIAPLFFLNSWISDRVVHDGLIEFHYGPLFLLTSAWILVLVSGGLALLLYRYYRIIRNRRQRAHLRLLLIGTLLSVIFVYVCSVLLPVLGEYRLDNIGPPTTLVLLTLLIYSILTHGFFDLRTFWLRAGLSLVTFVLGGLVLCGLGYWILEHYEGVFTGMKIATLVGLFGTGILYGKKVEPWIRSRFFVRRPRAEEIITSLFHSNAGLQERSALDQVLENILQSINRAIPFQTGFIVSMNRNAEARVFHRGRFSSRLRSLVEEFLIPLRLRQSHRYSDVPMTETMILEMGLPSSLGVGSSFFRKYRRIALRIEQVMRSLQEEGFRVVVPLIYESRLIGFIGLGDKADHSPYYSEDVQLLDAIRLSVSIYLHNHIYFESLESSRNQARSEAQRLSQFLADRSVVRRDLDEHTLIYKSEIMHQSVEQVHRASGNNRPVLITGETGTGKELIARLIHQSDREGKPFVVVNCAAIPASLLEDEIFGHVKGAFTDARSDRVGKAAEAGEGTLFFDEVGEMPLELQAKLLRLLQDGQFSPVGDNRTILARCRFIFATNRNLKESILDGSFREDLYYRINAFAVALPPLRERKEDIGALAEHFSRDMAREMGRPEVALDSEAQRALESYSWPGNIRELQNVLLRAIAGTDEPVIARTDLPQELQTEKQRVIPTRKSVAIHTTEEILLEEPLNDLVENYTRRVIEAALEKTGGNRTHAAGLLGLGRTALLYRMKQLGL